MENIKIGNYIYDITEWVGGFQINQYKVIFIDANYIYCINQKGIKGRFNRNNSILYTDIKTAKEKSHQLFFNKIEKEKRIKSLKKAFYNSLKSKQTKSSIYNYLESDLEKKVRQQQIDKIKYTSTSQNKIISRTHPANLALNVYENNKKLIQPTIPYKILPSGAFVAVNKENK